VRYEISDLTDGEFEMRSVIAGGLLTVLMSTTAFATTSLALNAPIAAVSSEYNVNSSYYFQGSYINDGVGGATANTSTGPNYGFWVADSGVTSAYVTIDLGASYNIGSFVVQDTHNQVFYDRGTKDFKIGVGSTAALALANAQGGSAAASGTFSVSDWKNLTDVTLNTSATGEFVTFLALTAYSNAVFDSTGNGTTFGGTSSVGLNEISVFAATGVPEPISMAVLGSGLIGLAALRRRRV
jgi:hypothetical protein